MLEFNATGNAIEFKIINCIIIFNSYPNIHAYVYTWNYNCTLSSNLEANINIDANAGAIDTVNADASAIATGNIIYSIEINIEWIY